MKIPVDDVPSVLKKLRAQLDLSQEGLARELGLSFSTINRWENRQTRPLRIARGQLEAFCAKMIRQGKIDKSVLLPPDQ